MIVKRKIYHAQMCCGIGGFGKGFNKGKAKVGNVEAEFECLGGIDIDPASCRDFETQVGVKATCIDLFSREQYIQFHGHEPPAGWIEAAPDDLRRAYQNKHPHIMCASMPCKGFSGLLSEKISATPKYQALNGLTLRGLWLALEAYQDDPIELYVFENVPRIATRGRFLLDQIAALFRAYGYAVAETSHDCGEIGNLGQSRKRFLLVARYVPKIPCFLYEPVKHPLRVVGEILDRLPIPGVVPGLGGPMHRMPALQWKTWVRLAFVRAGADWRSLNDLRVDNGTLLDFGIQPDSYLNHGVLGVRRWDQHAPTVTGRSAPLTGAHAVADPRAIEERGDYLGVRGWDQHSGAISSRGFPTNGAYSVADPRPHLDSDRAAYAVGGWEAPGATVTSQRSPGQGRFAVADPRVDGHPKSVQLGVRPWEAPAGVVTGKMFVGGGPNAVADPRIEGERFNHAYRIVSWNRPSPGISSARGALAAVADPRSGGEYSGRGKYRITAYDEPANTVIGASTTGQGAFALADPRYSNWHPGASSSKLRVTEWEGPARSITGSQQVASGAGAVADPRFNGRERATTYGVKRWDGDPANVVAGESYPSNGAFSVADPRPEFLKDGDRAHYQTAGNYGVVAWPDPTGAIAAHGGYDNGRWSVADPRATDLASMDRPVNESLPAATDKLVCTIRALDGTWHRPFTTLELAALQGLIDLDDPSGGEHFVGGDPDRGREYDRWLQLDGFHLDGWSDSAWRERIGNMVPPPAAAAVAGVCGVTLLAAWSGQTFLMGSTPIWVRDIAIALMAAREA